MAIPLKREKNDTLLNVALPKSLDEQIRAFAEENGTSRSDVVRHILSLFFDDNFGNTKEIVEKTKARKSA